MGRVVSVFLLLSIIGVGLFFIRKEKNSVLSPIPMVFGTSKAQERNYPPNSWFPNDLLNKKPSSSLNLSSNSAILVDFDTGEIVFGKDFRNKQPVASTVKIMTALVALESSDVGKTFLVSKSGTEVGENSMGLTNGEKLPLDELLYGMMLVSGNDAAVTIAEGILGSEQAYVAKMNERAKELGMNDTRFANASGLDDDNKLQYSTAYDMAILAHYVWESYPKFREITSTFHMYIDATSTHKAFDLYNDTNLLTTYPGVKGIKPGFTWEAGLCLVTYAENDGRRLIGVILGSNDRRGEMKELLDFGFSRFGIKVDHPALD